VMSDYYLDLENNPYIQQRLDAMQQEGQESFDAQSTAAMSPFLQAGGTMGFTGANMANQAKMVDQFGENMANSRAGFLGDQYAMERGMQDSANQAWSGRESTYDASGIAGDATRAAARTAARASMYKTDSDRWLGERSIGAQSAALRAQQQQAMWGNAQQYADMQRQGGGLGRMGVFGQGMSQTLPWQQGFGVNTQQGPKQSALGGFIQGAIGGAFGGAGFGKKMGWGGGGGAPASAPVPWGGGFGPGNYFSDARLKDNIVRLNGEYLPGVPLATWTWKHNGEPGFGVIAQDLEQVAPERVFTVNGVKVVRLGG